MCPPREQLGQFSRSMWPPHWQPCGCFCPQGLRGYCMGPNTHQLSSASSCVLPECGPWPGAAWRWCSGYGLRRWRWPGGWGKAWSGGWMQVCGWWYSGHGCHPPHQSPACPAREEMKENGSLGSGGGWLLRSCGIHVLSTRDPHPTPTQFWLCFYSEGDYQLSKPKTVKDGHNPDWA